MYVLEGVTPCIQSMDLRAGDTGMYQYKEHFGEHTYGIINFQFGGKFIICFSNLVYVKS